MWNRAKHYSLHLATDVKPNCIEPTSVLGGNLLLQLCIHNTYTHHGSTALLHRISAPLNSNTNDYL